MIIEIPFEIGQKVWIWQNRPIPTTRKVFDGYDHLGPKSRLETTWTDNYAARETRFTFSLLDKYKIEDIFTSKEACELKQKSAF